MMSIGLHVRAARHLYVVWFLVPGTYSTPCVTTKISTPSSAGTACSFLFLANRALRIELTDAAALGAGRRVDHRVDEGRLAGVHGRVDGALELVGRCRLNAGDRKSTRLNSSHVKISYAVFCL